MGTWKQITLCYTHTKRNVLHCLSFKSLIFGNSSFSYNKKTPLQKHFLHLLSFLLLTFFSVLFFLLSSWTYSDSRPFLLKLKSVFLWTEMGITSLSYFMYIYVYTHTHTYFYKKPILFACSIFFFFTLHCYRLLSRGDLSLHSASGAKFLLPLALKQ